MNLNGRRVRDNRRDPPRTGIVVGHELEAGLRVKWDGEHGTEVVKFSPEVLRHVGVEVRLEEALRIDP